MYPVILTWFQVVVYRTEVCVICLRIKDASLMRDSFQNGKFLKNEVLPWYFAYLFVDSDSFVPVSFILNLAKMQHSFL